MVADDIQKGLEKANMQLAAGDFKKSFNSFKKIMKANENVSEAYFGMAEASIAIPKLTIQEIASYYQKACDLSGDNPLYYASYGNFCFENGILKKGEECFLKASEIDEENSSMYLSDLANSYYHSAHRFQNMYPNITEEEIDIRSLKYILMAFNLTKDIAKSRIDSIDV